MFYGYGILNNHVPTLRAAMGGGSINPLNASLYAVYKGESNANDSLGTYNGTAEGGLTYSAGKSGNAFVGNGTNAYVQLPNDCLNSLTGDFSFSFWVSFTSLSGGQAIISSLAYSPPNQWGTAVYASGYSLIFDINTGVGSTPIRLNTTIGQAMSINTNYFYTITRKGSTRSRIYRDGTLLVSNTNTVNPVNNAGNMRPSIGAINYGPLYSNIKEYYLSNGTKVDELNIWNKELTATEVTELYNAGAGKFYPY